MDKPLLLHALSLKDRMLEPNRLPLHGQVWGYPKDDCSHEMFVGHCLTMLSALGMQASDISWDNEVMAFDTQGADGEYTVVISLQDDSLASTYYYFLGIWRHGEAGDVSGFSRQLDALDVDLLEPAFSYALSFADSPVQLAELPALFGIENDSQAIDALLVQRLHWDHFRLAAQMQLEEKRNSQFVIAPFNHTATHVRFEVRHILYSIRNMMALTHRALYVYKSVWHEQHQALDTRLKALKKAIDEESTGEVWSKLVAESGELLLETIGQLTEYENVLLELAGMRGLLKTILNELHAKKAKPSLSLEMRLDLVFTHAEELMKGRIAGMKYLREKADVLLRILHARMLARQQSLLGQFQADIHD